MTELVAANVTGQLLSAESGQLLLFRLRESMYGVDVHRIREIVLLPQLTPVAEQPDYVKGVVSLRGEIVPVLDLDVRLDRVGDEFCIQDMLLVCERGHELMALVVNGIAGIRSVAAQSDDRVNDRSCSSGETSRFVSAVIQVDDDIVMVLDVDHLWPERIDDIGGASGGLPENGFFEKASAEDQAVFQARAKKLTRCHDGSDPAKMVPLVAFELGQETFAFEFDQLREFLEAPKITPIPCCPPCVLGNINVRGDILTVVDIRSRLNLPTVKPGTPGHIIVFQHHEMEVGIHVDVLHDVVYIRRDQIKGIPGLLQPGEQDFLKGAVPYGETIAGVIDLVKLFGADDWIIDEEIACVPT